MIDYYYKIYINIINERLMVQYLLKCEKIAYY